MRRALERRLAGIRPDTLGLPGPDAAPMVRNVGAIRKDPLTFLREVQARHGDVVAFPVPGAPYLLLNDPAAVRHVLVTNGRAWGKHTFQYAALAEVTGQGLLASWQPDWRTRRRTAQPAFHHGRVDALVGVMADAADRALDVALAGLVSSADGGRSAGSPADLPDAMPLDVERLSLRLTLDIVGETLFGADLGPHTAELVHATDEAAELIVARGQSTLPLPLAVPTPMNRRLRRVTATLDRLCRAIITERRASGQVDRGDDLLSLLLVAGLPDDAVRDELVTMVVAGHETVASGLAWALMLLAERPDVQERLREESDVHGVWTQAVVHETLRLFSPAWVITRRATEDDEAIAAIPSVGRTLPARTTAIISPWLVHRGPGWHDPEEFLPERWLPVEVGGEGVTPRRDDYLPFGQGARLCIGRDFALVEIAAVLQRIVARLDLAVPAAWGRPAISAFVTMRPAGGLTLLATPR